MQRMQSIARFQTRNELSLEQLAGQIGIHRSFLWKIMHNKAKPSVDVLRKMHEVTRIPVKTLLYECT